MCDIFWHKSHEVLPFYTTNIIYYTYIIIFPYVFMIKQEFFRYWENILHYSHEFFISNINTHKSFTSLRTLAACICGVRLWIWGRYKRKHVASPWQLKSGTLWVYNGLCMHIYIIIIVIIIVVYNAGKLGQDHMFFLTHRTRRRLCQTLNWQDSAPWPGTTGSLEANGSGFDVTRPGKRLDNKLENPHFQWVHPLFLWSFSIAMLNYQRVT